uniref:Uncharacterized protein n=1 Tax=Strigamia maritima TaxID=126957 RepID=T1JBG8_STRMM
MNSIASRNTENNAINVAPPVVQKYYTVKPELLKLFESVGAQGKMYFSALELKHFLGEYIKAKRLLDPSNCLRIDAANDPLGQVFGQDKFHAMWALQRLYSFLIPLGTAADSAIDSGNGQQIDSGNSQHTDSDDSALKRKSDDDCPNPNAKKSCNEYFFDVCLPPKPDSEAETIYSLQGYETAVAKDTTDDEYFSSVVNDDNDDDDNAVLTDWDNQLDADDFFENELEVEFEYEVSSLPSDLDSDTAPSVGDAMEFIRQTVETDIDFWADSSNQGDEATSEDPDITDCDKWMCKNCQSLNNPTIRYCEKCWQLRHNWLPESRPRPPKRLRKKRKRDSQRRKNRTNTFKQMELQVFNEEAMAGPSSQDTSNKSNESLCALCFDRPSDGCIVHGSTGHMIGCYKCLKTLKHNDKPCPICRAPIQKVIRVFKE